MNYCSGILVVAVGITLGFFAKDVNSVLQWIVSALYGGYIAANVLKWHWWRFNGHGYFWGMAAGIIASMVFPLLFPGVLPLYYFPLTFAVSVAGCFAGTYVAPPADDAVLKNFYRKVRPWGFWGPIHDKVVQDDPTFAANKNFKRDMFNVAVGIVWQTCLTVTPIYIIIKQDLPLITSIGILLITTLILKKNWYDRLKDDEQRDLKLQEEENKKLETVTSNV